MACVGFQALQGLGKNVFMSPDREKQQKQVYYDTTGKLLVIFDCSFNLFYI